ncbi:MAG: hypothetical protein ABRQ37_08070 [Candidatus Eremiobacterota bacterium]
MKIETGKKIYNKINKKDFFLSSFGFNLPELCMAIVILGTIVIVIIGMFIGGIVGMKKSSNLIIATNIIQSTLDQYSQDVLYDFDNILYKDGEFYNIIPGQEVVDTMKIQEKWVSFQQIGTETTNRLKKITVTLYWYEKSSEGMPLKKKMFFTTYINNYL